MELPPRVAALTDGEGLPEREELPRYVAPLPAWVENLGLGLAWPIVVVNLVGTAFGFWYYGLHPLPLSDPLVVDQFAYEPLVMWPFVPDSPVATLFIALSLAAWKLDRQNDYLDALAFFGCIKLGLWTPLTLLAFEAEFAYQHVLMYHFLFWSHLAMALEAFLLHRYSEFPVRAVGVALLWYGLNDLVDYLVPVVGRPHHTYIPAEPLERGGAVHGATDAIALGAGPHRIAAAAAVTLTLVATFLALATRVKKLELRLE